MQVLVERKVGRNGLMVMIALCGAIYADGRLGRMSSELMSDITGPSTASLRKYGQESRRQTMRLIFIEDRFNRRLTT